MPARGGGREPARRAGGARALACSPAMFAEMNRRTLAFRGGGLVSAAAAAAVGGGPTANGSSGASGGGPGEAWVRQEAEQLNGQGVEEEVELETVELEVAELEATDAAGKELLLLPTTPPDSVAAVAVAAPPAGPMFAERNRRTLAFRGGGSSASNNGCEVAGEAWPRRPLNGRGGAEEEELELEGLLEGKELVQDGGSLSDSSEDEEDGEGGSLGDGSGAEGGSCSSSRRSGGDEAEVNSVGAGEGESIQHFPLATRPKSLLQKLHVAFQSSWLKEFPWLQYCQQTGLMSCAWCSASTNSSTDGGSSSSNNNSGGGHDELCKGTRNYKRALLLRHHLSTDHRLNEPVTAEQVSQMGGRKEGRHYGRRRGVGRGRETRGSKQGRRWAPSRGEPLTRQHAHVCELL